MVEQYVDVDDFWDRTGLTFAVCDACDKEILRGGGHLLTTVEVTRSQWYRERCVPQTLSDVANDMNVNFSEETAQEVQLIMLYMAGRSLTQWLVCDECLCNLTGR